MLQIAIYISVIEIVAIQVVVTCVFDFGVINSD